MNMSALQHSPSCCFTRFPASLGWRSSNLQVCHPAKKARISVSYQMRRDLRHGVSPVSAQWSAWLTTSKSRQLRPVSTLASLSSPSSTSSQSPQGPILVWFKHDLRLDDHPGLQQALERAAETGVDVLPVYCFDPDQLAHLLQVPGALSGVTEAVRSLQRSLQALGSDLVVVQGAWRRQLPLLASQVCALGVVTEAEVEWVWAAEVAAVRAALGEAVPLHTWTAPLFLEFVDNFKELKQRQPGVNPPLEPPSALPPFPAQLRTSLREAAQKLEGSERGAGGGALWVDVPSVDEVTREVGTRYVGSLDPRLAESPTLSEALSADWLVDGTREEEANAAGVIRHMGATSAPGNGRVGSRGEAADGGGARWRTRAAWEAELAAELAAGEGPVIAAIDSYIKEVESDMAGAGGELGSRLAQAVAKYDIPATPDGSFPALFTRALALGVVSKRRLYHQAMGVLRSPVAQQAQRSGSPPSSSSPLGGLADLLSKLVGGGGGGEGGGSARSRKKAAAALAAAEARDFHEQMAAARQDREVQGAKVRHWRWRGVLTDYLEASPPATAPSRPGAPAILLVHGFGAFSEQWRDNVAPLAAAGFRVYAPTMPGYGRSEKPNIPYGQDLWRDFLHDFVLQVVRQPVVAAGNSIGGFLVASLAADFPGTCQGVVLLNSAGLISKDYQLPAEPKAASPPPRFVANAVSQALFSFLEGSVENQLRRLYPTRPDRADSWLAEEIGRAACDPGALGVFSYLVSEVYGGPTMVLQGSKDPLNDAVGRARQMEEICPNVQVTLLEAGHCPHDEVPEVVNRELVRFIEERVLPGAEQPPAAATPAGSTPAAA